MKTKELRDLSVAELKAKAQDLKKESFHLRLQQQGGQIEKPSLIKEIRKDVARIETILSERRIKTQEQTA
jgi:large subunit ribosomal protein L29